MQVLESSKIAGASLENAFKHWDTEVHCQAREHKTDNWNHSPSNPATVRGYAPCGKTMNICEKYSKILVKSAARGGKLTCQCGDIHEAKLFRFVSI